MACRGEVEAACRLGVDVDTSAMVTVSRRRRIRVGWSVHATLYGIPDRFPVCFGARNRFPITGEMSVWQTSFLVPAHQQMLSEFGWKRLVNPVHEGSG